MTIEEIIQNIKLRIASDEITIRNLSNTIDKNKLLGHSSEYGIGFQEGEREATIFNKERLEDLLRDIEEEHPNE